MAPKKSLKKIKQEIEEELEEKEVEKELKKMEEELGGLEEEEEEEEDDETEDEAEDEEDDEPEYIVEKFVGMKKEGRKYIFKVHWQGFKDEDDTWEEEEHLRAESGEEVIQLMEDFKQKVVSDRKQKVKGTRAARKQNWEYITIDDDDDKGEIPKRDRELAPDDEFFGEKAAEAKGEKKKLYDPSHKTSTTELFLAKVGTAERVTRQGIKKLMKGEDGSSQEEDKSRPTTPSAPGPSKTFFSIPTHPDGSPLVPRSISNPTRRGGRRISSRGRVLAGYTSGLTHPVDPPVNVAPLPVVPPLPVPPLPEQRKRLAETTLDGGRSEQGRVELDERSAASKAPFTQESKIKLAKSVPTSLRRNIVDPRKRVIMLDSHSLPRREGVFERERTPPEIRLQNQMRNEAPAHHEVHRHEEPRGLYDDLPGDSDDDANPPLPDTTCRLRDTTLVEVDLEQELTRNWAKTTAPASFKTVCDIVRARDPDAFESIAVSDTNRNLGSLLMQKDLNGSTVLHQICASPCDHMTHSSDDLIGLILRTCRSRRDLLAERNALGATPLHLAVKNGTICVVTTLLKHKAPLNIMDLDGYMAIDWAYQKNHAKMVDMLLMAGCHYERLYDQERRGAKKPRAFARLEKHALKMHSMLQLARHKSYEGFEEVKAVSPIFTMQTGEKEAQFQFEHAPYQLDGKHAYFAFFFVCDIQKENKNEWTARCWNADPSPPLLFKEGYPKLNGISLDPVQTSNQPLVFYCWFGDSSQQTISFKVQERHPLLVCCQVVLARFYEPQVRPIVYDGPPEGALEYAPLVGPL